jgi:hypothetical protein
MRIVLLIAIAVLTTPAVLAEISDYKGYKQGLYLQFQDQDTIRVLPGEIYVQGGGGQAVIELLSGININLPLTNTPADNGWWYVYVSRRHVNGGLCGPTCSLNHVVVHHEDDLAGEGVGDSKPVLRETRRGWYHPGKLAVNDKKRCIGAVRVTYAASASSIDYFQVEGGTVYLPETAPILSMSTPTIGWTIQAVSVPVYSSVALTNWSGRIVTFPVR